MKKSTDVYIRSLSKRDKHEDREPRLPVGYFGSTMLLTGEEYPTESELGHSLATLGRAEERVARVQDAFCANATSSWHESLERSLVQMKECHAARKRLESHRLAYDALLNKMEKSKREDFRDEEEVHAQRLKYEESEEDVYRRMLDIHDSEADTMQDLTTFLDAQLTYFDRCREILLQVKQEWPSMADSTRSGTSTPVTESDVTGRSDYSRSRASSITSSQLQRYADDQSFASSSTVSRRPSSQKSSRPPVINTDLPSRPTVKGRSYSNASIVSPAPRTYEEEPMPRLKRVPTEPIRSSPRRVGTHDAMPEYIHDHGLVTSELSFDNSPAPRGRVTDWSTTALDGGGSHVVQASPSRKAAPPPPPSRSRSKKPPPPPPVKRAARSGDGGSQM